MLCVIIAVLSLLLCGTTLAQSQYEIVKVNDGGSIAGSVKWSGPQPRSLTFPITKDPQVCDPESRKQVSLDRLVIGPDGGVANTVVFLRDISKGKAMDLPEPRRFLDQKHCRYEPHILLVPQNSNLQMKSSDATLHTVHMEGAATYNLPFPFPNNVISRPMPNAGLATLRCNGGHVWMNAEMFVAQHPYYAVTDESGRFELTDVPAGDYELVAWHEGWNLARKEASHDVLTQRTVERPVFSQPRTWERHVRVSARETSQVSFVLSEK
ncbi:MAG TPA: carboxypeptidase-like regulatory domain-containing protein [Terriglobales bacterium]|nr:carboxypeptidase-like regulatory domain-containing protein [Terriglobales bacterium]